MKKQALFFVVLTIASVSCYAQIIFEEGYFIREDGQKIVCLIKNVDWKNNPASFEYQLAPNGEIRTAGIGDVKEFGINGVAKYVRATVNIDRSGYAVTGMSAEKDPVFNEEQLFLKVLVEGAASLFVYEDANLVRFFYQTGDEIKQLVYKRYLTEGSVARNSDFRKQLFIDLKCPAMALSEVERVEYNRHDLGRFFEGYNECKGSPSFSFETRKSKDLFNLNIRPGLQALQLSLQNADEDAWKMNFGVQPGFSLGVEAEVFLPFNKNKWAFIAEPVYQKVKAEKTAEMNHVAGGSLTAKTDYQLIEVPVGVRHYFFLNEQSKIFANASYLFCFGSKPSIDFFRADGSPYNSFEMNMRNSQVIGVGYKFRDKYSVEMRYRIKSDVLNDYLFWSSGYQALSVIVGYSLF